MGNCFAYFTRRKPENRRIILLLIGLDNAGKTQTVNNLIGETDLRVLPTVGFKAVNLIHRDTPVTIYDLGGGPQFREIWSQYYSEVFGIIFVIDSSDYSRLTECKEVLKEVISHNMIAGKPILILANKQDKRGALDDIDIVDRLNIEPLVNKYRCPTLVESYSATLTPVHNKRRIDPGLKKGYSWILNYILSRYGDINLRVKTDIYAELQRRKNQQQKQTSPSRNYDEITGFENPNYSPILNSAVSDRKMFGDSGVLELIQSESSEATPESNRLSGPSKIIMVKLAPKELHSASSRSDSPARPKLSPVFGKPSSNEKIVSRHYDLETRIKSTKLPIRVAKDKYSSEKEMKRPHTYPVTNCWMDSEFNIQKSFKKNMSLEQTRDFGNSSVEQLSTPAKQTSRKERTFVVEPKRAANTMRPVSASEAIRRQLEYHSCNKEGHKRRYSLKYVMNAKTAPEPSSLFHYEPLPPGFVSEQNDDTVEMASKQRVSYFSHSKGDSNV